jgi:hypothetical protein
MTTPTTIPQPITEAEADHIVGVLEIDGEIDDYELDPGLGHRYWTTDLNVLTIAGDGHISYITVTGTPVDDPRVDGVTITVSATTIEICRPGHPTERIQR